MTGDVPNTSAASVEGTPSLLTAQPSGELCPFCCTFQVYHELLL